jgi:hypothetical protein
MHIQLVVRSYLPVLMLVPLTVFADAPAANSHTRLLDYVGTYETDQLMADTRVAPLLQRIAGPHLEHLQHNLNVLGSVDLVGGWLKLAGNAPHGGTEEEAVLCISPDRAELHAAILSKGEITVLTELAAYVNLPLCIKDWITQVNSLHKDRMVLPANVSLEKPARPAP